MRKSVLNVLSITMFCVAQVSYGEISTEELPDMGNLALLVGEAETDFAEESILDDKGRISSGLPVDNSLRGVAAAEIASVLAQGSPERQQRIEQDIDKVRVAFEEVLTQANFEVNDVGVGLATSFIVFWELASNQTLPDASALKIGKFLVNSFKSVAASPRYENLSSEDKSRLYDWTMTYPVAFVSMVKGLEAQGAIEEAQQLREKSASLFEELFKFPHTNVTLSDAGEISVNTAGIVDYQEKNGLSDDW